MSRPLPHVNMSFSFFVPILLVNTGQWGRYVILKTAMPSIFYPIRQPVEGMGYEINLIALEGGGLCGSSPILIFVRYNVRRMFLRRLVTDRRSWPIVRL